jgi:hypothetical protein
LCLLKTASGALGIEVDDVGGGKHLDTYDGVVASLEFGST